jgi:predicted ArsR family transcriptional regulator
VSAALEQIGFVTSPGPDESLITSHCPFGTTAAEHPEVVCRIDQGIVGGLLEAARGEAGEVVTTPRERPDEACVTDV